MKELKIICLEDSKLDASLIYENLSLAGYKMDFEVVSTEKQFLQKIRTSTYDLILSDYNLPGFNGMSALIWVKEICPEVPFICISGTIGEDTAVEMLKKGAADYILKDRMGRLPFAIQDILEKGKEKQALRQSEENFRRSMNESPLGIRIVTKTGETIYVNQAILDIYGYENIEELRNTPTRNRYTPESYRDFTVRYEKRQQGADTPSEYEVSIINKNNQIKHLQVLRKEVIWDGQKQYQVLYIDITEHKQALKELVEAKEHAEESDKLKSAFLANMSHEIRTPMNGILGFAELLKEPNLTGEEQLEYIRIIEKGGARLLNIINEIIDISKIESGLMEVSFQNTNINEKIEHLYHFFKPEVKQKGLQMSVFASLHDSEATIKTDGEKIFAILTNLIKNAIKYTNEGSIKVGYHRKGDYLKFFVRDTGIGIARERQTAIFDRFIQADIADKRAYQGAGLGLSIARAYVEMLKGTLWVESEEGQGSTFYFTIPVNP